MKGTNENVFDKLSGENISLCMNHKLHYLVVYYKIPPIDRRSMINLKLFKYPFN